MKKFLASFLLVLGLLFYASPAYTYAASNEKTNDVTIQQDGDALFLTTTATYSAQKESSQSAKRNNTFTSLQDITIEIPQGFATNIGQLLNAILSFVMLLGALLVFLQLILAGFYWITSGGDKGKVDSARQRLIAAVVGLIILASSFAILTLGLNFLGFESLEDVIKNAKTIS